MRESLIIRWALVDPVVTMECGRLVENTNREDLGVPAIIKPGYSEMILFEKNVSTVRDCLHYVTKPYDIDT